MLEDIAQEYRKINRNQDAIINFRKMQVILKHDQTSAKIDDIADLRNKQASIVNYIGLCYNSSGKFDQALECYNEAVEIWKAVFGPKHANVATALNK